MLDNETLRSLAVTVFHIGFNTVFHFYQRVMHLIRRENLTNTIDDGWMMMGDDHEEYNYGEFLRSENSAKLFKSVGIR